MRNRSGLRDAFIDRIFGRREVRHSSPVASMRGFWGLMSAYWLSERWREAWGITVAILILTAFYAKANVWFAVTSGELINRIAYFHDPATPTTLSTLLTTFATLAGIAILRDAGFTATRHFLSTTLHRRWRAWLDQRFNEALFDSNHTHFHLQQIGADAAGTSVPAPDNIDQRIQESIKGMTGGAIGLAMGVAGVVLSLGFVGSKLIETSTEVSGLMFLGSYGSAVLAFVAIAVYVPINTLMAARLGGLLQRLSVRMQWAEGGYRNELNTFLHRSFHVAVLHAERAQKAVNQRRYRDIDQTWASQNKVTAAYMGFELVHNFVGARIVAYAPNLIPYINKTISLQQYVTGAELANALINDCSWFIHVMPDIATLRANARRITDLAQAIECVQQPEAFYAQSGPCDFKYSKQDAARGVMVEKLELLHARVEQPFLVADRLEFAPGEWTLIVGESGSGKTSLLKAMNRLWAHGRGSILTPRHVRALYAAQDIRLQAVSLRELICLPDPVSAHSEASIRAALSQAGLEALADALSDDGRDGQSWDQLLSGGQKQKLVLARILLLRPGLIFLDEATSALDAEAARAFHRTIKDACQEATVIAVMHDISPIRSDRGIDFFDSVLSIRDKVASKGSIEAWRKSSMPAS
ncbi:ABC transporter ATP-binding protein/permease [Rhizobium sp. C4]|uniref:ABC transporter ATP-binding protein/permease n=1 Tax=Rhizobium sp. C4 TaxID=1349800 RepID=UPI001E60E8B6|nr:ATP-binding cassette domain-containing protein [Rhizobium sp. C4]MCD2175767.1 ATP-binding cassette domain-containing protein [Rhizobium sp. C4]